MTVCLRPNTWRKSRKNFVSQRHGGHELPSEMIALEPRVMLDGAAAVAIVAEAAEPEDQNADNADNAAADGANSDPAAQAAHSESEAGGSASENSDTGQAGSDAPRTIVIVDAGITDAHTLLNGIDPTAGVYHLNPGSDGVHQITNILNGLTNVADLHILSHGSTGSIILGATTLNASNIESYTSQFIEWDIVLADGADILLYGCNVGQDDAGMDFIDLFADLTNADVAASSDLTGHENLGGDWDLEVETGAIEAATPFAAPAQAAYLHTLAFGEIGADDFLISDAGGIGLTNVNQAAEPAIAYNSANDEYLVVWRADDTDTPSLAIFEIEIFGRRVDAATGAQIGSDFRISDASGSGETKSRPERPSVAYNSVNNEYLVVWQADDADFGTIDNEFEIYGQRIDAATGSEIGGDFRISDVSGTGDRFRAAHVADVVYNSTDNEYLVVWQADDGDAGLADNYHDIFGQRLDGATGAEIGANDFRISDAASLANRGAGNPSAAYNSTNNEYLVVWGSDDPAVGLMDNEFEIFGQRLAGGTGAQVGADDFRITDHGAVTYSDSFHSKVAYNSIDNEYMVVWETNDAALGVNGSSAEVAGQRLAGATAQNLGDAFLISDVAEDPGGAANAAADEIAIAYNANANEFLVTWEANDTDAGLYTPQFSGASEKEIFGQRISGAGIEIGDNDFLISSSGGIGGDEVSAKNSAIAYSVTSNTYLTVWQAADTDAGLLPHEQEILGQLLSDTIPGLPPENTVPAAQTIDEDTVLVFSAGSGNAFAVSDADAAGTDIVTMLSVTSGTITVSDAGTADLGGNGSATVTITGTVAEVNAALATVTFVPTQHSSGAVDLTMTTRDSGNTGLGGPLSDIDTVTINVTPVADAPTLVLDAEGPAAPEFQINAFTNGSQIFPAVASLTGGGFVTAWRSEAQDGDGTGIFAQIFGADGKPVGNEFRINTETIDDQTEIAVTGLTGGGFLASWASRNQDGSANGVYGQRFDASGGMLGLEFRVNTTTASSQQNPSITELSGGGFVVAWSSLFQDGSSFGVFGQRYSPTGATVGGEFQVNSTTEFDQSHPSVIPMADDSFVVVWASDGQDGSFRGIFGQRFDAASNKVGGEFQVNTETNEIQTNASAAALTGGGFVVTWQSLDQDGDRNGVYGQLFDAIGARTGTEFRGNSFTADDQHFPSVTALADGGFTVIWTSDDQDGDHEGVFGQRYAAAGNPVGTEFRVNTITEGNQRNRSFTGSEHVATLADGRIVAVWDQSLNGATDVFARIVDFDENPIDNLEDHPVAILLDAMLVDQEGSESLSVTLSGFPAGTTFNFGAAGAGDTWVIPNIQSLDLSGLELTPPANYNGTFTLTATARATEGANGDFAETTATTEIVILPVNDAPTSADATIIATEDTTFAFSLSDFAFNDVDIGDSPQTLRIDTLPAIAAGVLELNNVSIAALQEISVADIIAGNLTFVPAANVSGTAAASFTFSVSDGEAYQTAANTILVDIAAGNNAPQTNAASGSGNEDAASISVALSGTDPDGTVESFRITSLPSNGTLFSDAGLTSVVAQGGIVSATGNTVTLFFVSNANFNGEPTFTFAAIDDQGLEDATPANATITVIPVNDAPTSADATITANEDTPFTFSVSDFAFNDVDTGDSLQTIRIDILPSPAAGILEFNNVAVTASQQIAIADIIVGNLTFVPTANVDGTAAGTFTFSVSDGNAFQTTPNTITIDITSGNDAPQTNNAIASGNEDAPVISVGISGSDVDGTVDAFRITSLPANGTLFSDAGLTDAVAQGDTVSALGNAATLFFVPNANFNGAPTFSFAAIDNLGLEDSTPATATITVNAINDAPQTNIASATGDEDAPSISVSLAGSDIDGIVDGFRIISLPSNGTLFSDAGLTNAVNQGDIISATGNATTLFFVPAANFNGAPTFSFAAIDGLGLEDTTPATATITVNAINDAPETNIAFATGNEDAPSIPISLAGSDIDGTVDGFRIASLPSNGTLFSDAGLTNAIAQGDIVSATANAVTLFFVPDADFNGAPTFTFAAVDDQGLGDATPATATITVISVNDAPTSADATITANEDTTFTFPVSDFAFNDVDTGDNLQTVRIDTLPAASAGVLELNNIAVAPSQLISIDDIIAGNLTFVPAANADGTAVGTFTFSVSDGTAFQPAPNTITIDITSGNDAPQTNNAIAIGNEDAPIIIVGLSGSDIDGSIAGFRITSLPTNGTLFSDAGLSNAVAPGDIVSATSNAATLFFVPDANFNGAPTFSFAAIDDLGLEDSTPANATITVNAINDAPETNIASATGDEDVTAISIGLSGSDIDGTVASFRITSLPSNGTLFSDVGLSNAIAQGDVVSATGNATTLFFVPDADFNGAPTFTFAAIDNLGLEDSTTATATITVNAINDAPTSADATTTVSEDTTFTFSLADFAFNDVDTGDTQQTVRINTLPSVGAGVLELNNVAVTASQEISVADIVAGNLTFVPASDVNGTSVGSFTFSVSDGAAFQTTANTITIDITSSNDAPQTVVASTVGNEDAASISVLLSGTDLDGIVESFRITSLPANGTLFSDAGLTNAVTQGDIVSASGNAATLFFVPDANFNGAPTFTFAAIDDLGLEDPTPANATITVNDVNDEPETNFANGTGNEDATSISVELSGTDIDGDIASFRITSLPANGTLFSDAGLSNAVAQGDIVSASGNATTLFFVPNANFNGAPTFTFAAIDDQGLEDATPAAATITVSSVNDAPQTNSAAATGNEDTPAISVGLSAADIDGTVDAFRIISLPSNGTLFSDAGLTNAVTQGDIVSATGNATTLFFVPDANFNGVPTFTFAAIDDQGLEDAIPANATVTVIPVNDAPTSADATITANEDTTFTFSVSNFAFNDVDTGDNLQTVRIDTLPAASAGVLELNNAAVAPSQLISIDDIIAGNLTFVPAANADGTAVGTFTFSVSDGTAFQSAANTITIDITSGNDAPQTDIASATGNEDAPSISVAMSGSDIDGSVASFRITSLPANGTLFTNAGLTNAVNQGDIVSASGNAATLFFVPDADFNGAPTFTFAAIDDLGLEDSTPAIATITVNPVNDGPQTNIVSATGDEDVASISVALSGSDPDGTVESFRITGLPANGALFSDAGLTIAISQGDFVSASGNAATLFFVPDADFNGAPTFTFAAIDDLGLEDPSPATATITVTAINDAPQTNIASSTGNEDAASIPVPLSGSDIDGSVASFRIINLPSNGTLFSNAGLTNAVNQGDIVSATGNATTLFFVPNADFNGAPIFTFAAIDNLGQQDATPATATITVNAVNDAPQTDLTTATGNEDAPSIFVSLAGSDIDGTIDGVRITGLPSNGTLFSDAGLTNAISQGDIISASGNAATLFFVPDADFNGAPTFTFAAIDDLGLEDATPAIATITVNAVNDAPTSTDATITASEDTTFTFSLSYFAFSDTDSGDSLQTVRIDTLPAFAAGVLELNNVAVSVLQEISVADIDTGKLTFVPAADVNGSSVGTFTFSVSDGTAFQSAANTITIDISSGNDAPQTNNAIATGNEDAPSIPVSLAGSDIDGSVANFRITSLPSNGTLFSDAGLTNAVAQGSVVAASGNAATLFFVPDADFNGAPTFTFAAIDDLGLEDSTPAIATITITPVNDGPQTNLAAATGNEDAPSISISLAGSDIDGTVAGFRITSLPTNGTLFSDADLINTVAQGDIVSASGNSTTLFFVPDADFNGAPAFTFAAIDEQGLEDATPATATITVSSVNDAPTSADATITAVEDTTFTFTVSDFVFNDVDTSDSLQSVRIDTLPAAGAGALQLNNVAVTASQLITLSDIVTGNLTFIPATNVNGTAVGSFTFSVSDGAAFQVEPNTINLDIIPVNEAPVNSVPGQQATVNDTDLVFSAANGNLIFISDADAGDGVVTTTLAIPSGALTVTTANGAVIAGNGTGTVTISGTIAQVNAALSIVVYAPDGIAFGPISLTVTTNDNGNTGGGNLSDTDLIEILLTSSQGSTGTDGTENQGNPANQSNGNRQSNFNDTPGNPIGFQSTGPGNNNLLDDLLLFGGGQPVDPITTAGVGAQNQSGNGNSISLSDLPGNITLHPTSDTGFSNNDNTTGDPTPLLTGEAPANSIVTITSSLVGVLGTATANENGQWSFIAPALSDGVQELIATPTDEDGKEGVPSLPLLTTIDTLAPDTPPAPTFDGDIDQLKSNERPTFKGTAEPGARIVLTSDPDGNVGEVIADENGNWRVTTGPLSENAHRLTVVATDAAGNSSNSSADLELVVRGEDDTAWKFDFTPSYLAGNDHRPEQVGANEIDIASLLSGFAVAADTVGSGQDRAGQPAQIPGFTRQLQTAGIQTRGTTQSAA